MESLDLRVLADVLAWRRHGHKVTLVTVVETWGSAPRPPGALLAVRDDGLVSGSVSGGCVEDDLIARIKAGEYEHLTQPSMVAYGVTKEEASRFGLPCGGTLRLVQEPVPCTSWIEDVLTRTSAHQLVARTLSLKDGGVQLRHAQRGETLQFDGTTLTTLFGPRWRLLLIGAGQLSQAVAHMAQWLDFEVLVCDPREEYAASLSMTQVTRLPGMPDDVVKQIHPDAHTAIVALTHDPKLDDMALMEALNSDAFYIGALGSRRNQASRKTRLAEHFDLSEAALSRLHGPVGLQLAAKTPAEIAISILAEIVQVKNTAMQSTGEAVGLRNLERGGSRATACALS
jgi:xanthine dehydrogenase accessory factor